MPSLSAITAASFSPRSNSPRSNSRSPVAGSGAGSRAASRRAVPAPVAPAVPAPAPPPAAPEEALAQAERGAVTVKVSTEGAAPEKPKKRRRSRVPGNLAQMYGESTAKRDLEAAPAKEPEKKPRRDSRTRELRQAVIQVDETLLQRLSQSAATALIVGEEAEAPARRGRTWQAACGKCGTRSTFRTAGALCPGCGAICLRDAA